MACRACIRALILQYIPSAWLEMPIGGLLERDGCLYEQRFHWRTRLPATCPCLVLHLSFDNIPLAITLHLRYDSSYELVELLLSLSPPHLSCRTPHGRGDVAAGQ